MSKTVIPNNDVVHYAADMQTQSTTRDDDKDQAIANQHNTIVIKEIITHIIPESLKKFPPYLHHKISRMKRKFSEIFPDVFYLVTSNPRNFTS